MKNHQSAATNQKFNSSHRLKFPEYRGVFSVFCDPDTGKVIYVDQFLKTDTPRTMDMCIHYILWDKIQKEINRLFAAHTTI